jgi:trans-aconitate methyltransferase
VTSRSAQISVTLRRAVQLDKDWMRAVDEDNRAYTPWMPFNSMEFLTLLAEADAAADVTSRTQRDLVFLDVGCGPGPKMLIARDLFGLDVRGFDRRGEYVSAARTLGLDAEVADAETYGGYGAADIIWANRVARDGQIQARIEQKMMRDMKPGAIVIMANMEIVPPGWHPVLEDAEARRGIWQKPA